MSVSVNSTVELRRNQLELTKTQQRVAAGCTDRETAAEFESVESIAGAVTFEPMDGSSIKIEDRDADELLFDAFRKARRRFPRAIVGISDRTMIMNTSAAELLASTDRHELSKWMHAEGEVPEGSEVKFHPASGLAATARRYPVGPVQQRAGIVLQISVYTRAPRLAASSGGKWARGSQRNREASPLSASLDPALLTGWCELTDSERAVAELVGRGLSNKETGRRLFMSRHTVDSHLRWVFKKLGITSRVELARLLGEHYESLSHAVPEEGVA
jgi:DNA-binding CsgD family transcriptional regulator